MWKRGCDWMWSVWRRCQQGSWTLAVRALQRRSRGMRRRTRAGRSAGMLAGEVLTAGRFTIVPAAIFAAIADAAERGGV